MSAGRSCSTRTSALGSIAGTESRVEDRDEGTRHSGGRSTSAVFDVVRHPVVRPPAIQSPSNAAISWRGRIWSPGPATIAGFEDTGWQDSSLQRRSGSVLGNEHDCIRASGIWPGEAGSQINAARVAAGLASTTLPTSEAQLGLMSAMIATARLIPGRAGRQLRSASVICDASRRSDDAATHDVDPPSLRAGG